MQKIRLEEIKGLNLEEGLKNCGTEELYIQTLENFYKLIDRKSAKLQECLSKGLIREYTIEVHALKNTARMAGAMELSELFYQMECFGKEEKIEEIRQKMPEVLQIYRNYKELLSEFEKVELQEEREADLQIIKELLQNLHDAVDSFDLDAADTAMHRIQAYRLPDGVQQEIKELAVLLADVEMEAVLRLSEALEHRLNKLPLILLIDDDEINRLVVRGLLGGTYRMILAESGEEAFFILERQKPDLILLDVYMPQMDGHEVLKRLKEEEQFADIPVVFLTGDEDEQTEVQGFSEGATDFIRKPMRKAVAVQRINRILELSYLQKNLKREVEKQTAVAEKRRQKVERMSLQMVQALANTIDAKDSYTNGHSTRVAKYAVMLAERMGYEGERLEQLHYAALLHDITKALDGPLQLTLCREYGINLDDFSAKNPKTLHALTGSLVAEHIFGENKAVVAAICSHTTGKANMNLLEKIVYVADYMEPNRDFPGVDELRELAFRDIDLALKTGLEMTISMLRLQKKEISKESQEALQWLDERMKKKC